MTNIEVAFKLAETIARSYLPGILVELLPDRVFTTAEGKELEPGAIKVSAPWSSDALYLAASDPKTIRARRDDSWVTFLELGGQDEGEFHRDVLIEDAIWFILTTPIAWEIQAGVGSLDYDNGLFVSGKMFEYFLGLRKPASPYDQKIVKWYSKGDLSSEYETVQGTVDAACHAVDKTYINEGLTDVLFRAEDGQLYTIEAVIDIVPVDQERAENEYEHLLEEEE